MLTDGKPALIRAENIVPLYRRNALTERQLLAVNEVAGVLDTTALIGMRRQVAAGPTRRRWPPAGSPNTRWDVEPPRASGSTR